MFATKKHVAGTEGTHNYVVVGEGENGLTAVRLISGHSFRVRVQPKGSDGATAIATTLTRTAGWKQPGDQGQDRFSTVCAGGEALSKAVSAAVSACAADCDVEGALAAIVMIGSTSRDELIERVRQSGKPGVNGAVKWTTTTLLAKLVAETGPEAESKTLAAFIAQHKVPGANLASTWGLGVLRRKAIACA